jgi:hypothetical protein
MSTNKPIKIQSDSIYKKIRNLIYRMKTRSLVGLSGLIGIIFLSMTSLIQQGPNHTNIIFLLCSICFFFGGLGGVIMILRKEFILSGESDNIFGIIYGIIMALLGFGLMIFFIVLCLIPGRK